MSFDILSYGATDGTITVCTVSDPPSVTNKFKKLVRSPRVAARINFIPISSDTKILGQSNGNKKKDIVMEKQTTTEAEIGCHIDGVAVVSQQVVPPYGEPNN
ncbi:hypothetical protein Tco_1520668 [Tanacetum coccineum]